MKFTILSCSLRENSRSQPLAEQADSLLRSHGHNSQIIDARTRPLPAFDDRIKHKTPLPDSEALLRRIIADHQRGEPDYERMSPPLAALAREQSAMIKAYLENIGLLESVSFKGVGPGGWDVYDVRFENGNMEWGFALAADGKFSGIYLQRSL